MKRLKIYLSIHKRFYCRNSDFVNFQNDIFDAEAERQRKNVGRIEKIQINYCGRPQNAKILMNKHLSTPYHAAQHISEWLAKNGALALVDEDETWDMHRSLEKECNLRILTFTDADPYLANKAFWRTCSFLLGAVIKNAFRSDIPIMLHSFPSPKVKSGSFVHDCTLDYDWNPNGDELRSLSADFIKLAHECINIERLQVSQNLAEKIFSENHFKLKQIPSIAQNSGGEVTLYRVQNHIDISKGPMVSHTGLVSRASVASVHKIESPDGLPLYRFQGVALPTGLTVNHFVFKILEERARKLNQSDKLLEENLQVAL